MSETAVQKFDSSAFRERVENKIKAEFMELLPDEMFRQMVQDTLDRFTKPRRIDQGYGRVVEERSDLERIVLEVYEEHVKSFVRAELSKEEWVTHWDGQRYVLAKAVEAIITQNAGKVLVGMLGGVSDQMIDEIRRRI